MDIVVPLIITAAFIFGVVIGYGGGSWEVHRLKAQVKKLEKLVTDK